MSTGRVPFHYYLLTGMTGLAFSLLVSGWINQLSIVFGIHTVSIVTILISALLCMCLGSSISGRLSERAREPLIYFIVFSLVVLLFVLSRNLIFGKLTAILTNIYETRHPGNFGTGLLRFLFSLVFLLIPLSLLSALFPLVFRHFIRSIHHSGIYMSATLISLSFAALAAVLMTSFFLVPLLGMNALFYPAMIILLIMAGSGVLIRPGRKAVQGNIKSVGIHTPKAPLRFRKKKTVLEISVKLTRAMLRGSVFHAFSFSSMLVLCYRILIKHNLSGPVIFHTIILVIILLGIITGSLFYKRTVDKPANKFLTLATLQVIAGFAALICYSVLRLFAINKFTALPQAESTIVLILRQSALFAVLLFIPSAIYGLSFPLAGRLYPKRIQHTGRNFSKLACLVFFSVIASLIITPFILIPFAGLDISFILLSFVILLSGVYLILRDSRLIRVFRVGYGFSVVILFLMVGAFIYVVDSRQRRKNAGSTIEGSTASVRLVEKEGSKVIYLNNKHYLENDSDGLKEQLLAAAIPVFLQPDCSSVMVIGFGTGITASVLDQYDISELEISEIFPELVRMSSYAFSNENNDILTGPRTNIRIEDARSYLYRESGKYDLITMGSDQLSIFPGRYTQDFYKLCKSRLNSTGIFCQVIPLKQAFVTDHFLSVLKTTASVFENNSLWLISGKKMLLVSGNANIPFNYCRFAERFEKLQMATRLSVIGINDPADLAGHLVVADHELAEMAKNSRIITDNRPYASVKDKGSKPDRLKASGKIDYFDFSDDCADSSEQVSRIRQLNQSLLKKAGLSSVD